MSDAPAELTVPTGTVSYKRKITPRQYESAELMISIPFEMPMGLSDDETDDEFLRRAKHAATQAKALTFEELGLEFELGPNGVLQEKIRQTFPGTVDVTPPPAPQPAPPPPPQQQQWQPQPTAPAYPPSAPAGDVPPNPPYDPRTYDQEQKKANTAWARQRMAGHPEEFYDNRAKKQSGEFSPKGPDFKHRDTGIGIWIN